MGSRVHRAGNEAGRAGYFPMVPGRGTGFGFLPPTGGALVVSNHSGGLLTPDPLILGPAFFDKFGYDRPLYTLAHYGVFFTPFRSYLGRIGAIHASPENAVKALLLECGRAGVPRRRL